MLCKKISVFSVFLGEKKVSPFQHWSDFWGHVSNAVRKKRVEWESAREVVRRYKRLRESLPAEQFVGLKHRTIFRADQPRRNETRIQRDQLERNKKSTKLPKSERLRLERQRWLERDSPNSSIDAREERLPVEHVLNIEANLERDRRDHKNLKVKRTKLPLVCFEFFFESKRKKKVNKKHGWTNTSRA